jgi:hypothetical protein
VILDVEKIANIRVLRDRFSGDYLAHVEFELHAEVTPPRPTVAEAMTLAADIVRAELRSRPTIEVEPIRFPSEG